VATVPPNLKDAHECGDCAYFEGPDDGQGHCTMYKNYPVGDDEVCDSWIAGDVKDATRRAWAKHRRNLAKGA
jgi:hypothetical protein